MIRYFSNNMETTTIAAQSGDNEIHYKTCCEVQLTVILVHYYMVTIINLNILYHKYLQETCN